MPLFLYPLVFLSLILEKTTIKTWAVQGENQKMDATRRPHYSLQSPFDPTDLYVTERINIQSKWQNLLWTVKPDLYRWSLVSLLSTLRLEKALFRSKALPLAAENFCSTTAVSLPVIWCVLWTREIERTSHTQIANWQQRYRFAPALWRHKARW